MYLCMYVYVYVHVYVYLPVYMSVDVYLCMCMCMSVVMCMCTCMCMCMSNVSSFLPTNLMHLPFGSCLGLPHLFRAGTRLIMHGFRLGARKTHFHPCHSCTLTIRG